MKMKMLTLITLSLMVLSACNKQNKIVGTWIEPTPGTEIDVQGINLFEGFGASSINLQSFVYEAWEMPDNNTLILKGRCVDDQLTTNFTDTLKIVKIDADSLILNNKDLIVRYARAQ